MPLLATESIVLHAFDYSESSRILRLATRDAGVVSVLARGARRSAKKFGSALDLFAQGQAHVVVKEGRDLQTLAGFDVQRGRPGIGDELGRFAGASALAELVLRFGTVETGGEMFDALAEALDALVAAPADQSREAALAGAWRLVSELGFAPSLAECSLCHASVAAHAPLPFSHRAGGVLCSACASRQPGSRVLPPEALSAIVGWTTSAPLGVLAASSARAHQRLLREFLEEHLADNRSLRAFQTWEHGDWSAT